MRFTINQTHPTHDKYDTEGGHSLRPQWFFYVPMGDGTATSTWSSEPREGLTVCGYHSKGTVSTFVLSYFKTLSVGPAGVRTRDLPLCRPVLYHLPQTPYELISEIAKKCLQPSDGVSE